MQFFNKKIGAFTLAEALITLGIIGVVAAVTIPAVIVNVNQQEYKTGLKKAVNSLNSAISLGLALDGTGPGDVVSEDATWASGGMTKWSDLFKYFQKHMSVIKSTTKLPFGKSGNYAFYTTDGIRYEIPTSWAVSLTSHERGGAKNTFINYFNTGNGCGNSGYTTGTVKGGAPCIVIVDVNGDKKPNPANPNVDNNTYTYADANSNTLKDVFLILIINNKAIPYGVAAQRAMYSGD